MDRQSIFRVVNVPCNTIRMDTYHYTFEQIYRRYNTENSTVSLGEKKKKCKLLQHQGLPATLTEHQQREHYWRTASDRYIGAGRRKRPHLSLWSLFPQWRFPSSAVSQLFTQLSMSIHFYLHSKVYLALIKIIQNTKISVVQKKTH